MSDRRPTPATLRARLSAQKPLAQVSGPFAPRNASQTVREALTPAELEILRPLARRTAVDDMAEQLNLPIHTTEETDR